MGEIFGIIAGLGAVETLPLFFELLFGLRDIRESTLLTPVVNAGLVGEFTALSMGLGLPDSTPPGVLTDNLGAFCSMPPLLSRMAVSDRGNGVFAKEGSGRLRSSSMGNPGKPIEC